MSQKAISSTVAAGTAPRSIVKNAHFCVVFRVRLWIAVCVLWFYRLLPIVTVLTVSSVASLILSSLMLLLRTLTPRAMSNRFRKPCGSSPGCETDGEHRAAATRWIAASQNKAAVRSERVHRSAFCHLLADEYPHPHVHLCSGGTSLEQPLYLSIRTRPEMNDCTARQVFHAAANTSPLSIREVQGDLTRRKCPRLSANTLCHDLVGQKDEPVIPIECQPTVIALVLSRRKHRLVQDIEMFLWGQFRHNVNASVWFHRSVR